MHMYKHSYAESVPGLCKPKSKCSVHKTLCPAKRQIEEANRMEVAGIYSVSQPYIFKMEHPHTHTHTLTHTHKQTEQRESNKLSCSAMQKQLLVVGHQQHHQQQRNGLINIDNRRRMH